MERFTKKALQDQDGKTVPLTAYPGGPVIGEATLKFDADAEALKFEANVTDPKISKLLSQEASNIFSKGE